MYSDLTWHIIKLHHDWHLKQFIKEKITNKHTYIHRYILWYNKYILNICCFIYIKQMILFSA